MFSKSFPVVSLRTAASLSASLLATVSLAPLAAQEVQPAPPPAKAQPAPPAEPSQEVVVSAKRSDVRSSADRTSFDITGNLTAQSGTLADALRAVPGVEVDLQGGVSLRGDSGVRILIDGRPSALIEGEACGTAGRSTTDSW